MSRFRSRRLCRYLSWMKISLYIHIPFCLRKCLYCDFNSGPSDSKVRSSYVENLLREIVIKSAEYLDREVISIFFGGGTPSVLEAEDISRIMETVRESFFLSDDCEVSMEVNPATDRNRQYFEALRSSGVNRLSIGLQSADDAELKKLGRLHNRATFEDTYMEAVRAGFENINIDLMSGIPGQTTDSLIRTLEYVTSLSPAPSHVSAYSLIIEEGTPFGQIYAKESPKLAELPSEEEEREMYYKTEEFLAKHGYVHYEISNYAKEGYECRHNTVYWQRGDYLGLGLESSSKIGNRRWKNAHTLEEYMQPGGFAERFQEEELSACDEMEETVFLGLRMMKGISITEFENTFRTSFPEHFREVADKYIKLGLIEESDDTDRLMLTKEGISVSNVIFTDFLFT